MNDHNLDDLIIDDAQPKKNKTKSLLTIFALLIVVFIVAIILTSVVLDDPKGNDPLLEENDTEMISPELTLQSVSKSKKEKEETKLTEIIEDELNKPLEEPTITKEPKAVDTTGETIETQKPKTVVIDIPKPVVVPISVEPTVPVTSVPETKIISETPGSQAIEIPKTAEAKQHNVPSTVPAPTASGVSYYIQVGSFSKEPSKRLISSIKNNGFNYKLTTPNAKGIKKLLIGPYPSRPDVDTAAVRVKDLINKNAFVVKK